MTLMNMLMPKITKLEKKKLKSTQLHAENESIIQ